MAKIFSEAAMKEIMEHVRKDRSDRRNKPLRHERDETDPQTPEVYIAKAQSASGIPALSVPAGTGGDPDSPGTDTADIYKINSDGELEAVNFDVIVYNLTSSVIPDTVWTTVHRSKYGKWLILPSDVGGAFIAKPQSASGIPAITRGTPDVAGSDTCDIYQLNDSDEVVEVSGQSEEVFNLTDEIIPQDWVLIVKTNFGKWIAVPSGSAGILRRFTLKTTLTPGGSATAHPLDWTGSSYVADETEDFTVYDALGRFRGLARPAGTGDNAGSQGYARFMPDRGVWEIITMDPHALMIKCQANGAVVAADSTFSVDNVVVMQPTGGVLLADVTSVNNTFSFDLDDDAIVIAVWNEATASWDALQGECPA